MMTKPWGDVRDEIIRLYITEGRTLKDVQEIMKVKHAFLASIRSYRQHFDTWGVEKYKCKKREMRRKKAIARNILPSPPITPMVSSAAPAPAPAFIGRNGPPQRLPLFPGRTNSSSSASSSGSTASSSFGAPSLALSSLSDSPRPVHRPPYSATSPRAYCYLNQLNSQASGRVKISPSSSPWKEGGDLQSVLRSPAVSTDVSLCLAPYRLGMDSTSVNTKGSSKLLPGLPITHDPDWPRSGGSYHVYSFADLDRMPYQDAMPRTMPDSPYSRPTLYQPPSPELIPRLKPEPRFEETSRLGYDSPSP